jgi:tRNA pseudouridine55 synthase
MAGAVEATESDTESLRERLVPADVALAGWPACRVVTEDVERFSGGQQVACDSDGAGLIKVYGPDERFLGVGELTGGNNVAPKRIFMLAG